MSLLTTEFAVFGRRCLSSASSSACSLTTWLALLIINVETAGLWPAVWERMSSLADSAVGLRLRLLDIRGEGVILEQVHPGGLEVVEDELEGANTLGW